MTTAGMGPYPVRIEVDYPERMSRLTTFFRGWLVFPHIIVLALLGIVVSIAMMLAWFAIMITGKCPRGLHNFITGYLRWSTRVNAYSYYLTDKYPPFTMK